MVGYVAIAAMTLSAKKVKKVYGPVSFVPPCMGGDCAKAALSYRPPALKLEALRFAEKQETSLGKLQGKVDHQLSRRKKVLNCKSLKWSSIAIYGELKLTNTMGARTCGIVSVSESLFIR